MLEDKSGVVAAYAKAMDQMQQGENSKVGKVITLSAPLSGSSELGGLPVLPKVFPAIKDLSPESEIINYLRHQGEGSVNERFVTLKDELIKLEEMNFDYGREHRLDHGHFNYMLGPEGLRLSTAKAVQRSLLGT